MVAIRPRHLKGTRLETLLVLRSPREQRFAFPISAAPDLEAGRESGYHPMPPPARDSEASPGAAGAMRSKALAISNSISFDQIQPQERLLKAQSC
ncbi:hypothetical protein E2320_013187 [Naja naja]|nr:hypothetical protein E2320_013187 [Naja naja]